MRSVLTSGSANSAGGRFCYSMYVKALLLAVSLSILLGFISGLSVACSNSVIRFCCHTSHYNETSTSNVRASLLILGTTVKVYPYGYFNLIFTLLPD